MKEKIVNLVFHNESVNKYIKNIAWLMSEKIVRLTFSLLVGVWVARYLGPAEFGVLNFCLSLVTILSVLSTFGMDSIVVREFVNNKYDDGKIISATLVIRFLGTLILVALVLLFKCSGWLSKEEGGVTLILATSYFFQSASVFYLYFQSKVLNKYAVMATMFGIVISNFFKVYCIFNNKNIDWIASSYVTEVFISAIFLFYFFIKESESRFKIKWDVSVFITLLKSGFPLLITALAVPIYMKTDQLILNYLQGSVSVGLYAAASRLSEIVYFIPTVICSALFPAILNSKKTDNVLYQKRMRDLYKLMILLSLICCFSITMLSAFIIRILYGNEYAAHGVDLILDIHIWTSIFVFIGVANGKWLIAENYQRFSMCNMWLGAILNVVLNFILIPLCGGIGAALATLAAQAIASYFALALFKETRVSFVNITKSLNFTTLFARS